MNGNRISVVIPVHNREALIGRTIRSVLGQQPIEPGEIVVVDDASTDGTREVVRRLLRKQDRLICLADNQGPAAARNAGIDVARGDWVGLLDSDDEWFPNKLKTVFDSGQMDDRTMMTHRCAIREPRLERIAPKQLYDGRMALADYIYVHSGDFAPSAMLAPTSWLRKLKFESAMRNYEDFELLLRWQQAALPIRMLPEVLTRRYQDHGGASVGHARHEASRALLEQRHGARFSPASRRMFDTEYRLHDLACRRELWPIITESLSGRYGWRDRPRRTLTVLLMGLFPRSLHAVRAMVRRSFPTVCAMALGLCGSACKFGGPPAVFPPSPIAGVCVNVPDAVQLDAVRDMGFASFRDDCRWAWVEREKGVLKMPEKLERMVALGVERGLAPLLILDYANTHYDAGDYPSSPEAIAAFARFAEFTARHFHGRVWMYELWNEWNIGFGMGDKPGTPEWYARLSQAVDEALARVDPRIRLIGGALSGDGVWHGEIHGLMNIGAHRHWDGFSIHPYVFDRRNGRNTAERVIEKVFALRAILPRNVPVYITETGWPTHEGADGSSPEFAAAQAARLYLLAHIHNPDGGVWWYAMQDGRKDPENPGHRYGLLDPDGRLKPAGLAVKTVLAALKYRRIGRALSTGQRGVTAYECTNRATRRRGVVFWAFPGSQSQPVEFRRADGGPLPDAELTDLGNGTSSVVRSNAEGTVRIWSAMTPQLLEPTLESGFKALRPAPPQGMADAEQSSAQTGSSAESAGPAEDSTK